MNSDYKAGDSIEWFEDYQFPYFDRVLRGELKVTFISYWDVRHGVLLIQERNGESSWEWITPFRLFRKLNSNFVLKYNDYYC